jgi:hypothetical protein
MWSLGVEHVMKGNSCNYGGDKKEIRPLYALVGKAFNFNF